MQTSINLYQFTHIDDACTRLIEPWFQQCLTFFSKKATTALVVPSPTVAFSLKKRLITRGIPSLSVRFLTPKTLRQFILKSLRGLPKFLTQADYHFIIEFIAERLSSSSIAPIIARNPEIFRRFYDLLISAGWGPDAISLDTLREFALIFESELARLGFQTPHQADRSLLKNVGLQQTPIFDSLFLYGFSAAHWSLFSLLNVAVKASLRADICFPQTQSCKADEVWMGTWEECFGVARWLPEESSSGPLKEDVEAFLSNRSSRDAGTYIRIAKTLKAEVDVILAQILSFLSQENCERLGVVFVGRSTLAREVAVRLMEEKIPHHDTIGYVPRGVPGQILFDRWISFQEDASYTTFLNWINTLRTSMKVSAQQTQFIRDVMSTVFIQVRTGDFAVLKAEMSSNPEIRDLLNEIGTLLPECATFRTFTDKALATLRYCGWGEGSDRLEVYAQPFQDTLQTPISRRCFLEWLRKLLKGPDRRCSEFGCHPFSRVHLVSLQDASVQDWSHLILAGLSTVGDWQLEQSESALIPDSEIARLNDRALQQGRHGEGHFIANPGYMLSAAERRVHIQAELEELLSSGKSEIALTACLADLKGTMGHSAGDLLSHLYWTKEGTLLSQERLNVLSESTEHWLASGKAKPLEPKPSVATTETLRAWSARRCEDQPFGEFEYAFREPPPDGLEFSCKVWEQVLRQPASVWLEHVLGVRKYRSAAEQEESALALGTWVHDWLCLPQGSFCARSEGGLWVRSANERALEMREKVAGSYKAAGRSLPDWWDVEWNRALRYAQNLAQVLDAQVDWPFAWSEFSLPSRAKGHVSDKIELPLRGRIDLLLAKERLPQLYTGEDLPPETPLWIIDLKTGNDRPLKPASMAQGKGLQLALYALALRSLGCENVAISILGPDAHLEPQMYLDEVLKLSELWEGLATVQHSGVLGVSPPQAGYPSAWEAPLATLAIDPSILYKKWLLTHPKLPFV